MHLHRRGRIFEPVGNATWAHSHASNPYPVLLEDESVEIFFSPRDRANRSYIAAVRAEFSGNGLRCTGQPYLVLEPGTRGAFDEHGVSMGSCVVVGERRYLYYLGWRLQEDVPWRNTIGLAVKEPGDRKFMRVSDQPVLGLSEIDPHSVSYPTVTAEDGWVMWYGTNTVWGSSPDSMEHSIRRSVSVDGIGWQPDAQLAIGVDRNQGEYALARPAILTTADATTMVVGSRSSTADYRLVAARTHDQVSWRRIPDPKWIGRAEAWESTMNCYPAFLGAHGKTFLLYCGDGYGATGFGLAEVFDE